MQNWFLSKIKYEKTAEEGKIVKVSEQYLIDALTFGEAEERVFKELKLFISGEMVLTDLKRVRINEIFYHNEAGKWFKAKVNFIILDSEKGVEKKVSSTMLVQASDVKLANEGIVEGMKGSMSDYEIESITETKILDIFKYSAT